MRLIVFLAFVGSVFAQNQQAPVVQHATTVEQCKADQRLWDSQFVTWTEAFNNGHPFLSPLGQNEHTRTAEQAFRNARLRLR